jgi:hypothetical protein
MVVNTDSKMLPKEDFMIIVKYFVNTLVKSDIVKSDMLTYNYWTSTTKSLFICNYDTQPLYISFPSYNSAITSRFLLVKEMKLLASYIYA